jgi:alanine racemase
MAVQTLLRRAFVVMALLLVCGVASAADTPKEIEAKMKGFTSWLELDLDNLGFNLEQIRERTGSEVMPVIKNNAYGHGLIPITSYLISKGVKRVFVAKFQEAIEIRDAGLQCKIVNMGPLFGASQYNKAVELGVTQTVFTEQAARELSRASREVGKDAGVFVIVDTGLRRVGVFHDKAADYIEQISSLPGIQIEGMMSTFLQTPAQDKEQLESFLAVAAELKKRGVDHGLLSLASSDAIFHFPEAHLDLVRPGMSLYGVYPEPKDRNVGLELKQVLTFKARIELVKPVEKGDSVTYWGRFIAPKPMTIGTVHVGFYDGVPREMGNKGSVFFDRKFRGILGSVSLNHIIVDLTGTDAKVGDVVEVIGLEGENTLSRTAELADWMVYSLLNHLNPKTPRVYYQNGKPVTLSEY